MAVLFRRYMEFLILYAQDRSVIRGSISSMVKRHWYLNFILLTWHSPADRIATPPSWNIFIQTIQYNSIII